MKNLIIFIFLLISSQSINAQVGINTDLPEAELDINISTANLPALGLESQLTPTGTATGQLAVIGDKLYMYDATRGKWLTLNAVPLAFSRAGDVDSQNLRMAGNLTSANSGILMPYDGTVVAITVNSNVVSGTVTNNLTAPINIRIRDESTTIAGGDIDFNLTLGIYNDNTSNIDFNAGNHFNVRVLNLGTDTINNPVVTVWIKWRAN